MGGLDGHNRWNAVRYQPGTMSGPDGVARRLSATECCATFDVKRVRTTTWHVFEKLLAVKCGLYGTLLLGIDKDTQSGYLYAVGHANGLSTVIHGLGKVQGSFPDPVDLRWRGEFDPLNGD